MKIKNATYETRRIIKTNEKNSLSLFLTVYRKVYDINILQMFLKHRRHDVVRM